MGQGGRGWGARGAAALLALASVGACAGEEVLPAATVPSTAGSTTVATAPTTTIAVTSVSPAPVPTIPPPTCTAEVSPAETVVGRPATLAIRSNLPTAEVSIAIRLPTGVELRKARTDGAGAATHSVPAPRAAAGQRISVEVSIPVGPIGCTASYVVT